MHLRTVPDLGGRILKGRKGLPIWEWVCPLMPVVDVRGDKQVGGCREGLLAGNFELVLHELQYLQIPCFPLESPMLAHCCRENCFVGVRNSVGLVSLDEHCYCSPTYVANYQVGIQVPAFRAPNLIHVQGHVFVD